MQKKKKKMLGGKSIDRFRNEMKFRMAILLSKNRGAVGDENWRRKQGKESVGSCKPRSRAWTLS